MIKLKDHFNNYEYFREASRTASEMSVEIFAVGGYARDLILNRRRVDIDILVVGDGPAFAKKFSEKLGINDINIFSNFGTAHFRYHDLDFEFVGARRESYKKNSRNPFVEPGSFEDDINRRDFTINTLAVSLNKDSFGELIDVFGGLNDIKNKIIRTPLDPMITFDDDPLRILRAFRFAAQLNFDVSESIIEAARSLKERMKIIVTERKTDEFLKIISSVKPSIGLKLMYDTGIMDEVFPEISNLAGVDQRKEHHHKDVFLHTLQVLDNIAEKTDDLWLRFAALVHDIAKPPTKRFIEGIGWTFHGHEDLGARMLKPIFKRMKLPMSKLEYVQKLVRLHLRPIALVDDEVTDSAIRRLVVNADEDLEDLITLCRADITSKNPRKVSKYLNNYEKVMQKVREVKEKDKLRAFQSPVRGEEIMKVCGIPPSKTVGKIKSAIEEAILDGKIRNDYDEAYNYFLKIKDQYLE